MTAAARAVAVAMGLAIALGAADARGGPWDHLVTFCIDDVRALPERIGQIPIPLGCELIDCCPMCPGPTARVLDWRVQIAGQTLDSVAIEFEGLPDAESLRLDGDGHTTKVGAVVGRRGATLYGLHTDAEPVPVAFLRLNLDPEALAALQARGGADDGGDLDALEISIDQMFGPAVMNGFRLRARLRLCKPTPVACNPDIVVQLGNDGGDASVLLVDGNRAGVCTNDEIYRATATAEVGNLVAPASCRSELAVFSSGDAMELRAPESSWTNACGDQVDVQLKPRLPMKVNVWLARTDAAAAKQAANDDLVNAIAIYDENKTGITFSPVVVKTAPNDFFTRSLLSASCVGANAVPASLHVAKQLNVYYIDTPMTGETCDPAYESIYIGTFANKATLAHEFGHALSLHGDTSTGAHVDGLAGYSFSPDNVMWGGGGPARHLFSLGQAFRFNIDPASLLNSTGVRNGVTRPCQALVSSDACPRLDLDWSRP